MRRAGTPARKPSGASKSVKAATDDVKAISGGNLKSAAAAADDVKAIFRLIDKDKSGSIDAAELRAAVADAFPGADFTNAEFAAMFDEADVDHNGSIDFDEFSACVALSAPVALPRAW